MKFFVTDGHRLIISGEIAVEAFTCLLVFKNMFSFVLTFFAYNWFAHGGVKHTMIIIGSIQVGICLLSIPMCTFTLPRPIGYRQLTPFSDVFGKWNRSFFARHDILEMLHLW